MPQKNHGKNIDPAASIDVSRSARQSAGFVGELQNMRFVDYTPGLSPKEWAQDWQKIPDKTNEPSLFCIAIDGSLPPSSQSIPLPFITHHASAQFSFFPVCARAVPWPALFEKKLMEQGTWSPSVGHAMAHCSAGFVAALPGSNVGHGPDMAPIPSFLSATQAALEKPWDEWGFEKLNLLPYDSINHLSTPAETLANLLGIYYKTDPISPSPKQERFSLKCHQGHLLHMGSPQAQTQSLFASKNRYKSLFICDQCNAAYTILDTINNHIHHTASQRSMAFMELMEILLYVEMAERIKEHLQDPHSPFSHVVEQFSAKPLLLIKDGPLVVSPTSRLSPYLKSWAEKMTNDHSDLFLLLGIEKNSSLLSELARGYAIGELQVSHYCHLRKPEQLLWMDEGATPSKSKWAEKIAVILPQGACILSMPKPSNDAAGLKLAAHIGAIIHTLSQGIHPSSEGIAHFSLLAHLQKHTALPSREKAMGRFAYDKITNSYPQPQPQPQPQPILELDPVVSLKNNKKINLNT